jgi:hypothetical protein
VLNCECRNSKTGSKKEAGADALPACGISEKIKIRADEYDEGANGEDASAVGGSDLAGSESPNGEGLASERTQGFDGEEEEEFLDVPKLLARFKVCAIRVHCMSPGSSCLPGSGYVASERIACHQPHCMQGSVTRLHCMQGVFHQASLLARCLSPGFTACKVSVTWLARCLSPGFTACKGSVTRLHCLILPPDCVLHLQWNHILGVCLCGAVPQAGHFPSTALK